MSFVAVLNICFSFSCFYINIHVVLSLGFIFVILGSFKADKAVWALRIVEGFTVTYKDLLISVSFVLLCSRSCLIGNHTTSVFFCLFFLNMMAYKPSKFERYLSNSFTAFAFKTPWAVGVTDRYCYYIYIYIQ